MRPLALAVLVLCACLAPPAEAATRKCGNVDLSPQASDEGAFEVRATGVSCRTARAVARASKGHGPSGTEGRTFTYRARGFTCRGRETATALPTVRYVCRRGTARVRFGKS